MYHYWVSHLNLKKVIKKSESDQTKLGHIKVGQISSLPLEQVGNSATLPNGVRGDT